MDPLKKPVPSGLGRPVKQQGLTHACWLESARQLDQPTKRKKYSVGLVEDGSRSSSRRKGEKDYRILSLQNESVLRETNSDAGVVGERAFPLKSGSFKLVNVARWDHSGTEGESEAKGMIGVAHRDSKREAMPRAIPCNLVCDLPSFGSVDTRRVFMCDVGLCDEGS